MSGFRFNRRWNKWDGGEYGWETCSAELGVGSIDRKMYLRQKGRSAWQVCAVDFNVTMSLWSSSTTCSMISNGRCIGNVGRRGILIVCTQMTWANGNERGGACLSVHERDTWVQRECMWACSRNLFTAVYSHSNYFPRHFVRIYILA